MDAWEGGKRRSTAVGFYRHSVHPSLSACGSGGDAAEGVEVDRLGLAVLVGVVGHVAHI